MADKTLAPFIRGHGYELVVDMKNPGGGRLFCNLDDWIPWNVYLYGRYQDEARYEEHLLRAVYGCDVVFDIGANIGYYTIQFARILGKAGVVHAFEPLPYQYGVLERNISLNGLDNTILNQRIVSDIQPAIKRIYFSGMPNTGRSSLEARTENYADIDCVTIDGYCGERGIEEIDVVKIDVEGHEASVLRGMRGLLEKRRVGRLFVEINISSPTQARSASGLVEYLKGFGYKPYSVRSARLRKFSMQGSESLVLFLAD